MSDKEKRGKINELLIQWPKGTVATQTWLHRHGISRQLAEGYRRSGWVQRIGRGAYTRTADHVDAFGAIYTLQSQLGIMVHVGARTALEIQGYAHFLPAKNLPAIHLFGQPGKRLPSWFLGRIWDSKVRHHMAQLFQKSTEAGLMEKPIGEYSIRLSSPERAALEMAELVPREQSFEGAQLLMEGLTALRPDLVQKLLQSCKSVKAKRLFLYLAEKCGHAWLNKLDLSKVRLGSGKRLIVSGGRYNPKYRITVPDDKPREIP
ncbi:MAG TPA: type IV toxin-antitoxin system AbiEi family antitoxin [Elusimicrobiales bacterium]|nr:type IV toxin-antitoxin system AbiEi family antitoxin [Elusimicrobiales bacterium]